VPSEDEWQALLDDVDPPGPLQAEVFIKKLPGFSKSVLLTCHDGEEYAVKGQQRRAGRYHRTLIADQVIGRLGAAMGAPVGETVLVDVPQELIVAEPDLQHLEPGLAHACRWIPNCSEKATKFRESKENRERFARLAILYGLAGGHDQQVIYENQTPNLAHSVDHGHFLPPGAGQWTEESLRNRTDFEADPKILTSLSFSDSELQDAAALLEQITSEEIAEAVATVPTEWGITDAERVAVADYFHRAKQGLLEEYGTEAPKEAEEADNE